MRDNIINHFINNNSYNEEQFNEYYDFALKNEPDFEKYVSHLWYRYFLNKDCFIFQNSFFRLIYREQFKHLSVLYIKKRQVSSFLGLRY